MKNRAALAKAQTTKRSTLSDMIDSISWAPINTGRMQNRNSLQGEECRVEFTSYKKNDNEIKFVRMRISYDLAYTLGWKKGDSVLPMFDPNNEKMFLLVKSELGVGFVLTQESKSIHLRLGFRWDGKSILERRKSTAVDFEIYKKQLVFLVE
jgi:hypothetical protein